MPGGDPVDEGTVRGGKARLFEIKNAWSGDVGRGRPIVGSSGESDGWWDDFTSGWERTFDAVADIPGDLLKLAVEACALFRKFDKLISAGEQIFEGDWVNAAMNLAEAGAEITGVSLPVDLPNQPSAAVGVAQKVCGALEVVRTVILLSEGGITVSGIPGEIPPEARIAEAGLFPFGTKPKPQPVIQSSVAVYRIKIRSIQSRIALAKVAQAKQKTKQTQIIGAGVAVGVLLAFV